MKLKYIKLKFILLMIALFLTLFSCPNPVIEGLIKADEETNRPGSPPDAQEISQPRFIITDVADIAAYLAEQPANTAGNPVPLYLELDLGTMTNANSNWRLLLGALETAGKYVGLDLSACTIQNGGSTIFNPDYNVATGKDKIVEIALPDMAKIIPDGADNNPAFKYFAALESFSGIGLTTISSFAFQKCATLALTSLPAGLNSIGSYAFQDCANLALTELPTKITSIALQAFRGCTNL
ncbi:MAG: leucine-rich repeat domain-containing protein, partial [Treponema sp.]|nr:leucine-rich repeat domain-containing protein [Treponema sp.]